MTNCERHTAEISALQNNNERIMERLDRLEDKVDENNNLIRDFIASSPSKFASRTEFDEQKMEIERVRGAFRAFYWIASTLGVGGIFAVIRYFIA
jgi:hypothetical protein